MDPRSQWRLETIPASSVDVQGPGPTPCGRERASRREQPDRGVSEGPPARDRASSFLHSNRARRLRTPTIGSPAPRSSSLDELRAYPITFPCNSRSLSGTGFFVMFQYDHMMNRTHLDHRLARPGGPLIVPAVPPVATEPGERPLHDPPPGQPHIPLR